jgi:pilus assembly protein CpaC
VLTNGRISLRVRPEVSELSTDGAISLSGYSIPGLKVRRAETTVELGSGQSFMIAGLLSNSAQNTIVKLPGAGDLPILGSLFRSTAFKKGETELVIVVTPYLVKPVDAKDIKLPTDGFRAADALQQVLGNRKPRAVRPRA